MGPQNIWNVEFIKFLIGFGEWNWKRMGLGFQLAKQTDGGPPERKE